jgi:hypothetical protein
MRYHSGEVFNGNWTNDIWNGSGELVKADGSVVTGSWRMGRLYTRQRIMLAKNQWYEGELLDNIPNGKGTMTYANRDRYEGDWCEGKRHGCGTLESAKGERYHGDWKDDFKEGQGTYKSADGGIYKGPWSHGRQDGRGSVVWADGSKYEGLWKNGVRNGKGLYTSHDRKVSCCMYVKGKVKSESNAVMRTGDQYCGQMLDQIPHGKGKMTYAETGDTYEGAFAGGVRNGYEEMRYASGESYKGGWMNGLKNGTGTYEFADGRTLSGFWKRDIAEGECTLCLPKEDKTAYCEESYTGKWVNGELVGEVAYTWPNGSVYTGTLAGIRGLSFTRLKISLFETYFGSLLDAQPHGLGALAYDNLREGYTVHGSWSRSKLVGYTEKTLLTGEWYKGWLRYKKLNGQGSLDGLTAQCTQAIGRTTSVQATA